MTSLGRLVLGQEEDTRHQLARACSAPLHSPSFPFPTEEEGVPWQEHDPGPLWGQWGWGQDSDWVPQLLPEVTVHARVDGAPLRIFCGICIMPGATQVVGRLKHHWRSKGGGEGKNVPGSAQPSGPGANDSHT